MTKTGTSILFVNGKNQVLLLLRDNLPHIKYPNMWDIPGGNVEQDETPEECIVREMKEELELHLSDFQLFEQRIFSDRVEHTFWKLMDIDISDIVLHEGQMLRWFSKEEATVTKLAFDFNITIDEFFKKLPYLL